MGVMTQAEKKALRTRLRAQRRDLAGVRDPGVDGPALAEQVASLLDAHGLSAGATVTLYESTPVEPPTGDTLTALWARGVRVLVPITLPDLDLDWADAADPERTPLGTGAIGLADLVLTPGLSVDPTGTRLGQGGGCYDRALPRRRPGAKVVVLLHPEEYPGPVLPRDPHDQPVSGVVTAAGLTWIG